MQKGILFIWLAVLFGAIAVLFWRNELVYSMPTPVPANYNAVQRGTVINVPLTRIQKDKPLFLHFFNPGCPCSRFNMSHFKSLVEKYGDDVEFQIVVMSGDKVSEKEIQRKYDLNIPVLFDSTIAAVCGVYATPQAVILTKEQRLYYRGNYNKSRYCTDKKTNYAETALQSILKQTDYTVFDKHALTAYGCQLPVCTK